MKVNCLLEKPDGITAAGYVASGDYFWKSGMFMFTAGQYLAELERCWPKMAGSCRKVHAQAVMDSEYIRLDIRLYQEVIAKPLAHPNYFLRRPVNYSDNINYEKGQLSQIPLQDLQPDHNQPRKFMDPMALKDPAASIRAHGVLTPILFRVAPALAGSALETPPTYFIVACPAVGRTLTSERPKGMLLQQVLAARAQTRNT